MSVDIGLIDEHCCDAHNHQFTYNYTPMLREAGFPAWKLLHGLPASVLAHFLKAVILELGTAPDRFGPLIRGGGEWGTLSQFQVAAADLLHVCETHPDAVVRVS